MEAYKSMKRRELIRQGKSIPLTLLPTEPGEIDMAASKRSPLLRIVISGKRHKPT